MCIISHRVAGWVWTVAVRTCHSAVSGSRTPPSALPTLPRKIRKPCMTDQPRKAQLSRVFASLCTGGFAEYLPGKVQRACGWSALPELVRAII